MYHAAKCNVTVQTQRVGFLHGLYGEESIVLARMINLSSLEVVCDGKLFGLYSQMSPL